MQIAHLAVFIPSVPLSSPHSAPSLSSQLALPRPHFPLLHSSRLAPISNLESIPPTPSLLLRSWASSRTISSTIDLSRRFISVLFLSNYCRRAAYAEKQLTQVAEGYSVSRRLLILSAGLHSKPGDLLPWKLVAAAKNRGIDLSEERPCASFDVADYRQVKDEILCMAESFAHSTGGHLYEWERKVRLLCDFDGGMMTTGMGMGVSGRRASSLQVDVPSFDSVTEVETSMDMIQDGCDSIVRSLIRAGM